MSDDLTMKVASVPDREFLIAELWAANAQFAEVSKESGDLQIEVYPREDGQPWLLRLDELLRVLAQAEVRLLPKV
jgi:hypothetical protein